MGGRHAGEEVNAPAWSARYYRVKPEHLLRRVDITFQTASPLPVAWSLLGVRGGRLVLDTHETGPAFTRRLLNGAYEELIVVATTLASSASYDYVIEGPCLENPLINGSIKEPTLVDHD